MYSYIYIYTLTHVLLSSEYNGHIVRISLSPVRQVFDDTADSLGDDTSHPTLPGFWWMIRSDQGIPIVMIFHQNNRVYIL